MDLVRRRVAEAAQAMAGTVTSGDPQREWSGAVIDSRRALGGELYFALAGSQSDGHLYVEDALRRGAAAAVVHREASAAQEAPLIRVNDTYQALHALTRWVRQSVPRKLVGVTGSVGKTTTKELLAAMLATTFKVAKSPGNLNNLYGFPVALLQAPEDSQWMVAELGMSTPGELAEISLLARPDVVLFTAIRPVHLSSFGSLRAIAEAKAEILCGLAPAGLIVANADDPEIERIARRHLGEHGGRVLWYGMRARADVRLRDLEPGRNGLGSRFRLETGEESQEIHLPLHGAYNAENCLAAAACAHALGVPLARIAQAAAEATPAAMRGVLHRLTGGGVLIDDSYNANPAALDSALRSAARIPGQRHWAVLGDMLEMGPEAPEFHRQAGEQAAALGFDLVWGVGDLSRALVEAARLRGAAALWFPDAAAAAAAAAAELRPGDVALIKASRGVGLEAVVQTLLRAEEDRGGER